MKKIKLFIIILIISIPNLKAQTNWLPLSKISNSNGNNDIKSFDGKLFVSNQTGVFSSSDDGYTWKNLTSNLGNLHQLNEITITNDSVFFVRSPTIMIRSIDAGLNWELDTAKLGMANGSAFLYYDSISNKVFIGEGDGINPLNYYLYYKHPRDFEWTKITNLPIGLEYFIPVQMTRVGESLIIIDQNKRVFKSFDNGDFWEQINSTGLSLAFSQNGPSRLLSIDNDLYYGLNGIMKSTDQGSTWIRIDNGLANLFTESLYYDDSTMYTSLYFDRFTYKSTNKGVNWTKFGGSGGSHFKAMTKHNGKLYGLVDFIDSVFVYNDISSSVSDKYNSMNNISIYPNPAKDFVKINNVSEGSLINIVDINGNTIYNKVANQVKENIDTKQLVNGIYLILIINKGQLIHKKLIINKLP